MRIPERIEQPQHIQFPSENDPLAWAQYPVVYSTWLNYIAPQFEAEEIAKQICLGEALNAFVGDDNGMFILLASGRYTPKFGALSKQEFQTRIDWEKSVPLLPKRIKDIMGRVKNLLSPLDWSNPEDYSLAVSLREPLVTRAKRIILVDEICDEALETRSHYKLSFEPAWNEFIEQRKAS